MSSRSPRGSVSGATSAEVAADFEDSLKDLQLNNRYEISNLTIIAKENTEHAHAISRALETHIKTTSPSRKLPALYVLDSIVKNVGTPYTTYLGRNLFSTFMDAYVLVDTATRRNMEGMLKTWKEPVPGSIDTRPVFPPENVRPIDTALIKAKTAAIQNQRQTQQSSMALRGVSTPPQQNGPYGPPPTQSFPPQYPGFPLQQGIPQQMQNQFSPPSQQQVNSESLKRDIASLISRDGQALAMNANDIGLRTRLQALTDLQNLLNIRSFSPTELHAIQTQVQQLSLAGPPPPPPPQPTPQQTMTVPQWAPPAATHLPYHAPQPPYQPLPPPTHSIPPTLNKDAINGLQALLAQAPKPSTPRMRAALPELRDASHTQLHAIQNHTAAAPASSGAADLLSSLAKAGLINAASNSTPTHAPPALPDQDRTAQLLRSLQGVIPASHAVPPSFVSARPAVGGIIVPLSTASLKVFRHELINSLYDAQPNQCSTCGRRFQATDDARESKSRHLDWHFRTNQRIADPNMNRGHHRNWYVDELEWVNHVEFDPSTKTTAAEETVSSAKAKKGAQSQSVRAPAGMTKNTCNICFEEMKSSYSEELQDWIFADATINNGKIVHAQCLAEMSKSQSGGSALGAAFSTTAGNGSRERSATPDSLLGKRKAEGFISGGGARIKMG